VSEPVGDQEWLTAHLYKQAGVGVTQVMDTDSFDAGLLAAADHLAVEKTLCVGKQPVSRLNLITFRDVLSQAFHKRLRDGDDTVTLRCLGRPDDISAIDPLKCLVDCDRRVVQINIRRCQGTQLTDTHPCVIQCHERCVGDRFVGDRRDKLLKFRLCPELHFLGVALAHTPGFRARIFLQIVILHRIIHHRGKEIGVNVNQEVMDYALESINDWIIYENDMDVECTTPHYQMKQSLKKAGIVMR